MTATEITVVVAAVLAGSLVKSITGMGLPLVAIPVMSLFVDPTIAIAVLAIPNAAQNVTLSVRHRHARHDVPRLAGFCTAGVAGAALGAVGLGVVPGTVVRLALVTIVIAYLVTALTRPDLHIPPHVARRGTVPFGFVAGLFQGGVGISGPLVGTWHHGLRLPRDSFVFAVATVFFITGSTQAVVLALRGELDGRIGVSVLLTALVLTTIPVGARLRARLSGVAFERSVLALLAVSCVSLIVDLLAEAL